MPPGPWVGECRRPAGLRARRDKVRLVQGSHIVVPKLFAHDRAYIFQNPDGRVVFAIPYEGDFTLIGTTDRDYVGDPAAATVTAEEIAYLCETASACFARAGAPSRRRVVLLRACGRSTTTVPARRKAASRDYVLEMDETPGSPPLLSIIGGKITTYRRLAEAVLERLAPAPAEPAGAGRRLDRAARRCRAASSTSTSFDAAGDCAWRATTRSWTRATCAAWPTPTARRRGACSARPQSPADLGRTSAPR